MTPADAGAAGQVLENLGHRADACGQVEAHGFRVDPRHHPSAEGAVKMIPHGSDRARAEAIRQTFAELTPEAAGPGARPSPVPTEARREAEAGL